MSDDRASDANDNTRHSNERGEESIISHRRSSVSSGHSYNEEEEGNIAAMIHSESKENEEQQQVEDTNNNMPDAYKRLRDKVERKHQASQQTKGKAALVTAVLATTASVRLANLLMDEDDVILGAGALINAVSGGTGGSGAVAASGGAASMPAAQAAVLQHMAVGAVHNATTSVATATSAAATVGGAGGGGGMAGASAAANTSGTTVATTTTVVTAVAAGVYAVGLTGPPLVCPGVTAPDILPGQVSFDILGLESRPNASGAMNLASSFIEAYDRIFGCDSTFSRRMINCSLPCVTEPSGNFSSVTRCCEEFADEAFGNLVQCTFSCFVHCEGCPSHEPLFLVPELEEEDTFLFPTAAPTVFERQEVTTRQLNDGSASTTSAQPSLLETNFSSIGMSCSDLLFNTNMSSIGDQCSALDLLRQAIESQLCSDNSSDCRVVRSAVYVNEGVVPSSVLNGTENVININGTEVNATGPIIVDNNFQQGSLQTFVPLPTSQPSTKPSFAPTRTPSVSPSSIPSSQPSPFFLEAALYDERGFYFGVLVDGTTLSSSATSLTVRVDVPSNVQSVFFWFDDRIAFEDDSRPFYIAGEADVPFTPLVDTVGMHTLRIIAFGENRIEIDSRIFSFQVV